MAPEQQDTESLSIYEALALAVDRRREVFEVVESSSDPDGAVAGVQHLLERVC